MTNVTNKEIDYIKRAFLISKEYSGVDVAIDSAKFCNYFKHIGVEEIKNKVEYVLSTYFGKEKYTWSYSYDKSSDELGFCCHHISLFKKTE